MTYDLLIRRVDASPPINRHTWLNIAVHTPALFLLTLHPEVPEHHGIGHRAYGLSGHFGRPILIVNHSEDEFLPDLHTMARTLDAHLVHPDGTNVDAGPGDLSTDCYAWAPPAASQVRCWLIRRWRGGRALRRLPSGNAQQLYHDHGRRATRTPFQARTISKRG